LVLSLRPIVETKITCVPTTVIATREKINMQISAGKAMTGVCWDSERKLLVEFFETCDTLNSERCLRAFKKLTR
jgi:hypothetical protein